MLERMSVKRDRILALDILRGYFIAVIIIDHLAWQTNLFEPFTGKGLLWASAAEGFFTISGILVGYIYGPRILTATKKTFQRIWQRALLLYVLFVGSTLTFTLLAYIIPSSRAPDGTWSGSFLNLLLSTLSFQYAYGLNDFLSRYALFMLFAPLIVWVLAKYKRRAVIGITTLAITLWLYLQILAPASPLRDIAIWEIIFVPSIIIGFYLPSIEHWFKSLRRAQWVIIISLTLAVTIPTYLLGFIYESTQSGGLFVSVFHPDSNLVSTINHINESVASLVDKTSLGVLRLAVGVFWFWLLYMFTRRFEKPIDKWSFGFFSFAGRNSLTAYVVHAFVIFFIAILAQNPTGGYVFEKTLVSLLAVLVTIAITWSFTRLKTTR